MVYVAHQPNSYGVNFVVYKESIHFFTLTPWLGTFAILMTFLVFEVFLRPLVFFRQLQPIVHLLW